MNYIISSEELQRNGNANLFQGGEHGDVPISFFLVATVPGRGPSLHSHPYEEVFVVQQGHVSSSPSVDSAGECENYSHMLHSKRPLPGGASPAPTIHGPGKPIHSCIVGAIPCGRPAALHSFFHSPAASFMVARVALAP